MSEPKVVKAMTREEAEEFRKNYPFKGEWVESEEVNLDELDELDWRVLDELDYEEMSETQKATVDHFEWLAEQEELREEREELEAEQYDGDY